MNGDVFTELVDMQCPVCDHEHSVEKRRRNTQAIIKGETVDYEETYYTCPQGEPDENEFVPAAFLDENLLKARDSYRSKKGLLTSREISEIRGYYDLTQGDFSALLGWGEVTINRYESKLIQDETYDNIMRMVQRDPLFALECLERHREKFSESKYNFIRKNIASRVAENGNLYLSLQEIKSRYIDHQDESDINGYKLLDIDKLASAMGYFAQFSNYLYKVKLMKLLWYSDVINFKRHGKSLTGLVYEHMTYGALPIAFNEILNLPTVKVQEELIYEDISYKILPNKPVNISSFTFDELDVLDTVVRKFKNFKSREIVSYMHQERAYLETEDRQLIPYSLAMQLNELS